MIHTQTDSPLHTALKNHQARVLIKYLQQGRYLTLLNQVDSHGLTALQLAASLGMIEAVLWLIYAGANINAYQYHLEFNQPLLPAHKPCLYLAIEHQHSLLSGILLCLGANKQRCLDLADTWHDDAIYDRLKNNGLNSCLFQAILYWSVEHYHPTYQNRLLALLQRQIIVMPEHQEPRDEKNHPGLTQPLLMPTPAIHNDEKIPLEELRSCLVGLSEYAMYRQLPNLSLTLIRLNQGLVRINVAIPSVVYWAVKQHNKNFYTPWIQNDSALINITLQQLEATRAFDDYEYFFAQLSNQQQMVCLQSACLHEENLTLTPLQQKLYLRAKFNLTELFKLASSYNANDCLTVLYHAWQQRDYVALTLLITYFDLHALFTHLIQKNHSELLLHLMFKTNHYPYEIIQKIPHLIKIPFTHFLSLLTPEETFGIAQQLISFGLKNPSSDDRQPSEINHQKSYFKALKITTEFFLKHYAEHFHFPLVATNRMSVPIKTSSNIVQNARRFGMQLIEQSYDAPGNTQNSLLCQLTDTTLGPGQWIFDDLNAQDKRHFFTSSKKSYHYLLHNHKHKIKKFLHALNQELTAQSYWQHRDLALYINCRSCFGGLAGAAAMLATLSFCAAELQHEIQQLHALQITLANTPDSLQPNHYCDSYQCIWDNTAPSNSTCAPLCEESALTDRIIIALGLVGIAFPGTILLVMLVMLLPTIYVLCLGNSRFDDLPLTTFSLPLNTQAERLFEELNTHPVLIHTPLSNDSSIATICDTLKELQRQLKISDNTRRFFKAAPEPITLEEINDDSASSNKPSLSSTPSSLAF